MKNKKVLGTSFIITIIILMGFSIAMAASVSFPRGQKEYSSNYYFLVRHIIWLTAGTCAFAVTSLYSYKKYKKKSSLIFLSGLLLLVAVLIWGKEVNGAKRWLSLGSLNIQPSEFIKLMLIIVLAGVAERYKKSRKKRIPLAFNMSILIFLYAILVLMERAFSTTAQIVMIGLIMVFVSGIKLLHFIILSGTLGILGIAAVIHTPYRLQRVLGHTSSEGVYQAKQSLIAIGSGGLFGRFYGNGLQKYFYLPEIHTDYIFSGYAEETGFLGCLFLIGLYILLLSIVAATLFKIKDMYAKYILTGILGMLSIQILGNLAVVLGLVPSTGIPLPLMSYGGSAAVVTMASLGVVYNIIKSLYIQDIIEAENRQL